VLPKQNGGDHIHEKSLRLPDPIADRLFFEEKFCAGTDLGEKSTEGDGANHFRLHLSPVKLGFIDPQRAFHSEKHLGLVVRRPVIGPRLRIEDINRMSRKCRVANQAEIKGHLHLGHQQVILIALFLIFPDPRLPLLGRFGTAARQLALFFLLFLPLSRGGKRMAFAGQQAPVRRSVHLKNIPGSIGLFFAFGVDVALLMGIGGCGIPVFFIRVNGPSNDLLRRHLGRGLQRKGEGKSENK